jgi:hypothetical protein
MWMVDPMFWWEGEEKQEKPLPLIYLVEMFSIENKITNSVGSGTD